MQTSGRSEEDLKIKGARAPAGLFYPSETSSNWWPLGRLGRLLEKYRVGLLKSNVKYKELQDQGV